MTDEKMIQEFRRVMREEAEAVLRAAEYISDGAVVEVVRLLSACKGRVVVSGCGTSGVAARKIVHELCCVGCPASFLSPADAVHGGMGVLRAETSHSRLQRRQHAGARHAHSRLQGHRGHAAGRDGKRAERHRHGGRCSAAAAYGLGAGPVQHAGDGVHPFGYCCV